MYLRGHNDDEGLDPVHSGHFSKLQHLFPSSCQRHEHKHCRKVAKRLVQMQLMDKGGGLHLHMRCCFS